MFGVRGHRTLKPRSEFISKNLIFFNSKLNGRKLGFNTPLKVKYSYNYLTKANYEMGPKRFWSQKFSLLVKFKKLGCSAPLISISNFFWQFFDFLTVTFAAHSKSPSKDNHHKHLINKGRNNVARVELDLVIIGALTHSASLPKFQSAFIDSQPALTLLSSAPAFLETKSFRDIWDLSEFLSSHAALSF